MVTDAIMTTIPKVTVPRPWQSLLLANTEAFFHSPMAIDQRIPVTTVVIMRIGQATLAANSFGSWVAEYPYRCICATQGREVVIINSKCRYHGHFHIRFNGIWAGLL